MHAPSCPSIISVVNWVAWCSDGRKVNAILYISALNNDNGTVSTLTNGFVEPTGRLRDSVINDQYGTVFSCTI